MKGYAMSYRKSTQIIAGIDSETIHRKTGKNWEDWISILDRARSSKKSHKDIVEWLQHRFPEVGSWWTRIIVVGYEQARGMKEKQSHLGGFFITLTKTIHSPTENVFRLWMNDASRRNILKDQGTIQQSTEESEIHMNWTDGSHVSVHFHAKDEGKCKIALRHSGLFEVADVLRMKEYWTLALQRLKDALEQGS